MARVMMTIQATNAITVSDDVAADMAEAYETLWKLPVTRTLVVDFETKEEARSWVRECRAYAEQNGLKFTRKGDIKGHPERVTFRIYLPKEAK